MAIAGASGGSSASSKRNSATLASPSAIPTATVTPQAVATPGIDEILLDSRRKLDLARIRDALEAYRQKFGTYPRTNGAAATLCAKAGDAGCALSAVSSGLPFNDGQHDYWYESDGQTFTLFSRLQIADASSACPAGAPRELAGGPVFCLGPQGGR